MARFCTVCGNKLSFWDRSKACPVCRGAYADMIADEQSDRARAIAESFRQRLPEITDAEMYELLEKDTTRILGAVTDDVALPDDEPVMHTTLQAFKGFQIVEYKGIVVSKIIHDSSNAKLMNDVLTDTRVSYDALDRDARRLGANAVIGIDVSFAGISGLQNDNMGKIMETMTGTAVVVRPLAD